MEVVLTQLTENPRGVVLELEVVLCRRCEFVPNAVGKLEDGKKARVLEDIHIEGKFMPGSKIFVREGPLDFGLTSGDADADAGQHVVHEDIVDVVLADEIADEDDVVLGVGVVARGRADGGALVASEGGLGLLLLLCAFGHTLSADLVGMKLDVGGELALEVLSLVCVRLGAKLGMERGAEGVEGWPGPGCRAGCVSAGGSRCRGMEICILG